MKDLYRKFKQGSNEFDFLQLVWKNNFAPKSIEQHRYKLEQSNNFNKKVHVLFQYETTHANSIVFSELKTPSNYDLSQIISFLNVKIPDREKIIKCFLKAQKDTPESYYDITEHLFDCLDGNLKVSKALKGREIFLIQLSPNYNQPYEILSNQGTEKLIDDFYQPYFQLFSDYFVNTITGISIEPPELLDYTQYNNRIPWNAELPEFFSQIKGYNLLEYIPLLFYETYDSATVRHDFWQVLTHLCSLRYVAILQKWSNEHGINLAVSQPLNSHSFNKNAVILSENADLLCVHDRSQISTESIVRSNSAIYNSSEKKYSKADIILRQTMTSPVNSDSCPIVPLPINFANSQSISRINFLIGSSRIDSKILVIYPMSSFWVKSPREDSEWLLQNLMGIDEIMKQWRYDYDYGDEDLIEKFGKVHKKSKSFILNQKSYSVVIIPPCITLQESTVKLLKNFISIKGKLIALKPLPYLLKGKVGTDPYPLESLLYHRRTKIFPADLEQHKKKLKKILDKKIESDLKIFLKPRNSPTYLILQHKRKCGRLCLYFLQNSDIEKRDLLLEFNSELNLEEWNLETGNCKQINQWHANNKTYSEVSFNPKQLRIIVANDYRRKSGEV